MIGQQPVMDQQNLTRVLSELVTLVHDVDARLQNLKIGISQVLPQIAPQNLGGMQSGLIGATPGYGHLGNAPLGVPPQATPFTQGFLPGVATPTTSAFSPLMSGVGAVPGLNHWAANAAFPGIHQLNAGIASGISPMGFTGAPNAGLTSPGQVVPSFRR